MKKQRNHLAEDKQPRQPTAIFHLLPFLSPAVGPVAGKGAEALLKQLQSQDPVAVQVLDSKQVTNHHEVLFQVTNNTPHGVYIESAVLVEPGGDSTIKVSDRYASGPHLSFGDKLVPPSLFPNLLDPGAEMYFDLEFPLGDKERKMKWDSAGRLELTISRLDQSKSEKKGVTFLIRWNDHE